MALKTYERYLAREIVSASLLVLTAFLGLFAFFDLVAELGELGHGGYQLQHALAYVVLTLPGRAYELFPIAVLIGTLYALTLLARHSEITVLRASGLSTAQLLRTLASVGILFVIATFVIGEFVAPPAERLAQTFRLRATSNLVTAEFRSGVWVKDGSNFINIGEVDANATLHDVRIYAFNEDNTLHAITWAKRGAYHAPAGWRLSDVTETQFDGPTSRVLAFDQLAWKTALNPDILSVLLVVPERMSLPNLWKYIQHLEENHQKTQRYQIALWKKLVYPLASLVMMALALPFAYSQDRMSAVSIKVFTGVMIGVFFHMLNGLFSNLGVINSWTPPVAALTPSLLFLAAAASMLWWVERR